MSDPISLRKIPPEILKLAQELSTQTRVSINDVFRLALASGLLVEVTKVTPKPDGTFAGLQGAFLAKALRWHLGSAVDLLLEHEEHPYQATMSNRSRDPTPKAPGETVSILVTQEKGKLLEHSIEEDLDMLGIGVGLSETQENNP